MAPIEPGAIFMIYADRPRRYSKRGLKWSHISSPCLAELIKYAKAHGLKRKDRNPWIHYDVTAEELEKLPGIEIVSGSELLKIMRPYRVPKKRSVQTQDSSS